MQITKQHNKYTTEDKQTFRTFGEASGHCRRLAVAHYLQVIRHQLHEETGVVPRVMRDTLRDLSIHVREIMEELPHLVDLDTDYQQSPLQIAA